MELIDVAIFQFASLSGLRSSHKIRSDPVIDGVCAVFSTIIACAKQPVLNDLEKNFDRLGGWKPGTKPTSQLKNVISSRLRQRKEKAIRPRGEPTVPEALVYEEWELLERTDRLNLKQRHARCWRCKEICKACTREDACLSEGFRPE